VVMSEGMMDREWPHRVALPAYHCLGHNYVMIRLFCEPLSLCPRTHSLRCGDRDMVVFSFVEREQAKQFRDRFGGEFLDSATWPKWSETRARHTDLFAKQRLRNGRCINCDD